MTVTTPRQSTPTDKEQRVPPRLNLRIGFSASQTSTIDITGTAYASNGTMSASSDICEYDLGTKEKDFWDVKAYPYDVNAFSKA